MPLGPPALGDVVTEFSFPVTRRRFAPSATSSAAGSSGLRARGAATDTEILAHVWYDTDAEGETLPEGQRQRAQIRGCTVSDVRCVDDVAGLPADCVLFDGAVFEVKTVNLWKQGPIGATDYVEFTARRVVRT